MGRAAYIEHLAVDNPAFPYVSASDVKQKDRAKAPRPLTVEGMILSDRCFNDHPFDVE